MSALIKALLSIVMLPIKVLMLPFTVAGAMQKAMFAMMALFMLVIIGGVVAAVIYFSR